MDEGSAEGYGGCILDLEVELRGRWEDAIIRRCIGYGVAYNLADFDTAGLMQEQHFVVVRTV